MARGIRLITPLRPSVARHSRSLRVDSWHSRGTTSENLATNLQAGHYPSTSHLIQFRLAHPNLHRRKFVQDREIRGKEKGCKLSLLTWSPVHLNAQHTFP
jgi:hypothetical protein